MSISWTVILHVPLAPAWHRPLLGQNSRPFRGKNLSDAGAKSILVNLIFSDPDRDHPQDDAVFQDVLAHTRNVVLPITRLNPANDSRSQVAITRFAGESLWQFTIALARQ